MGKVRKKRKNTYNYNINRKKLKIRARKKMAPRIACTEPKYVRKPYVLKELKAAASLPSKHTMGISSDMVFYVRHMVENHGEDYKAMARDDQNYYQDTPKQIQRKVDLYRRHHPDEYKALITSRTKQ
ncbi:hypothetical protein GDO78_006211 [Eleutherodactylus coqui]|uniref:Nucleolar protein 16 n=1 Tax=Eleutherodactylus coqui TaxID=57060 RepID=A0A8J6KFY8_ELECQ|nr:hypothetical protein GDO78_006211 [Eleutherodactylus coqui]